MDSPKPKRRWRQFSLPALLVVMTVATMAYVGWVQHRAQQKQEETAAWLQEHFDERTGLELNIPDRRTVCYGFPF